MIIKSGLYLSKDPYSAVNIRIDVYPRSFDIIELRKQLKSQTENFVFVYDLPNNYTAEGKLLATVNSSLGTSVPARARELWRLPAMSGEELIEHLIANRPITNPCHPRTLFSDAKALFRALDNMNFFRFYTPQIIEPSLYQFECIHGTRERLSDILKNIMDFNVKTFGAYSGDNTIKKHLKYSLDKGIFQVGYVDTERSW
jgi:hypothetical protein